VCIDRMAFDERGLIKPVKTTAEGVEPRPLAIPIQPETRPAK